MKLEVNFIADQSKPSGTTLATMEENKWYVGLYSKREYLYKHNGIILRFAKSDYGTQIKMARSDNSNEWNLGYAVEEVPPGKLVFSLDLP